MIQGNVKGKYNRKLKRRILFPVIGNFNKDKPLKDYDGSSIKEMSKFQDEISNTASPKKAANFDSVKFNKLSAPVQKILKKHVKIVHLEKWKRKKEDEVKKILGINKKWRELRTKEHVRYDAKRRRMIENKCQHLKQKKCNVVLKKLKNPRKVNFVRSRRTKKRSIPKNILRRSMSSPDIAKLRSKGRIEYLKKKVEINKLKRVKVIKKRKKKRAKSSKPLRNFRFGKGSYKKDMFRFYQNNEVSRHPFNPRKRMQKMKSSGDILSLKEIKVCKEPNVDSTFSKMFPVIDAFPTIF